MRLAAAVLLVVAAACAKKSPHPKPRCIVTARLPSVDAAALQAKAPTCSVTVIARDTTTYADVVAAMDQLAKVGFVDFGIGDVVSKLPPPSSNLTATRTTNEGLLVGRIDGVVSAPMIVIGPNGDVNVGSEIVGRADDEHLTAQVKTALAKATPIATGSAAGALSVVISAPGSTTYRTIYRVARAADDLGYANFVFARRD